MDPGAPLLLSLAIGAPPLCKATRTTIDLPSASDPPASDEVGNDDDIKEEEDEEEEEEEDEDEVNNLIANLNTSVDFLHWADQETLHATSLLLVESVFNKTFW